ncbi:hypothetical protein EJB05_28622, partial [Eragrostis curvula]
MLESSSEIRRHPILDAVRPEIGALSTGVHWCLHLHRIDGDREYAEFMYLPIGLQTLITSKGVVADSGGKSTCSF